MQSFRKVRSAKYEAIKSLPSHFAPRTSHLISSVFFVCLCQSIHRLCCQKRNLSCKDSGTDTFCKLLGWVQRCAVFKEEIQALFLSRQRRAAAANADKNCGEVGCDANVMG